MKTAASENALEKIVALWNSKYPIGTKVHDLDRETETRSVAYVTRGKAVVQVTTQTVHHTSERPLTLLSPVQTDPPRRTAISCKLEAWKNHFGWNWHIKSPAWNMFSLPEKSFRSRTDATRAAERTAAELNITITETIVR